MAYDNNGIAEALRKSHCSRTGKEHNCVGTCKITPKGIELSCPVCGDDKQDKINYDPKILQRAKNICRVIGLNFDDMVTDVQKKIIAEIFKDYCPNCYATHLLIGSYNRCNCGWSYSDYRGWESQESIDGRVFKTIESSKPKTESLPVINETGPELLF